MVLDGGGVRAVVDDRAGRLDVILVGELRLELVLLEIVELGLAADDCSADLVMQSKILLGIYHGGKCKNEPERWSSCRTG
jgi:hypothetical protein